MLFLTIFGIVISVTNGINISIRDADICEDCTRLSECPQAMEEVNNNYDEKVITKLIKTQCRHVSTDFAVCCSEYNNLSKPPRTNNEDEIENHPNIRLLPDECGVIQGYRIIGGETASLYEFPWLVLISHRHGERSEFNCGGTLITRRYVLTAAHCIKGHDVAVVRVGEYDTSKKIDCYGRGKLRICESRIQDIAVSHTITHPNFRKRPVVINDIGLLRLQKNVDLSARNAGAICLPLFYNLRDRDMSGERGVVAGWGRTETKQNSNILLRVEIPIHSIETCKASFISYTKRAQTNQLFTNTLCAGELGADSCKGDSGGPLMVEGEYNNTYKVIQYGIVSYGIGCGNGKPAVYTDVGKFMKWILDTIKP